MANRAQITIVVVIFALLAVVPMFAAWTEVPFYSDFGRRIMILSIGALSLNLVMGYGGLISFGHAVYIGIGAYTVAICRRHQPADAGRIFHHDYAGAGADDVFSWRQRRPLWR
jgi:ABC-type branched-subunit amino acid transport system permease subunit